MNSNVLEISKHCSTGRNSLTTKMLFTWILQFSDPAGKSVYPPVGQWHLYHACRLICLASKQSRASFFTTNAHQNGETPIILGKIHRIQPILGFLGSTLKTSFQKPVKMRGVTPLCPRELLDSFDHSELEIAGLKGESLVKEFQSRLLPVLSHTKLLPTLGKAVCNRQDTLEPKAAVRWLSYQWGSNRGALTAAGS